jgi:DNA-binding transcriptional ArsR family regulator
MLDSSLADLPETASSAPVRVTFFQVRDYLGTHKPPNLKTSGIAVLRIMIEHAMYKGDDYGKVVFQAELYEAAGMKTRDDHSVIKELVFLTGASETTVGSALKLLEAAGLITRDRRGRKSHEADEFSVLPLLTRAANLYSQISGVESSSSPRIRESSDSQNPGVPARARSSSRERTGEDSREKNW